jgi:DNA topoisomerase-1
MPTTEKGKSRVKKAPPKRDKTLVIVESPAKAKTIERYLGKGYVVKASMGHLIDLPKSRMAVNIEGDFEPDYITVRGRAKILNDLIDRAKQANDVLLASDNDREGEAIAWHLGRAIRAKDAAVPIERIVFNEITPTAIKEAVANPHDIDAAKVNAQKARRVLDRVVGYTLSPFLWKKVKGGLSAGRVQSAALKLICDREAEVEAFVPQEYWTIDGTFRAGKAARKTFTAPLVLWQGKKPDLHSKDEADAVVAALKDADFTVGPIRAVEKSVRPRPPFTTSTMQQTAANRLGWTSKRTMQTAQRLYEGVKVGTGPVGLITYMRTDSVRISSQAISDVRAFLADSYPSALPEKPNFYSTAKNAQDAHEGIRPTYTKYTPASVKKYLEPDQFKLYSLVWERFVASQMKAAKTRTLSADIFTMSGGKETNAGTNSPLAVFRVTGTTVIDEGWYVVLALLASKDDRGTPFPSIKEGDAVEAARFAVEQHWTQGPSRYTDASIVKTLEENGIGRPSTYAPIISTLQERYYVTRQNRQLTPTVLGKLVNKMLAECFPDIVNTDFTAALEKKLDDVAEDKTDWHEMMRTFYGPFKTKVDDVTENLEKVNGVLEEPTDKVCDKCGRPMVKKLGRYGFFLACSGWPECRNARSLPVGTCPKCGGDIVERRAKKRGRKFYGCSNYPQCDFLLHEKPIGQVCPKCGWPMVKKSIGKTGFRTVCSNPDCGQAESPASVSESPCALTRN